VRAPWQARGGDGPQAPHVSGRDTIAISLITSANAFASSPDSTPAPESRSTFLLISDLYPLSCTFTTVPRTPYLLSTRRWFLPWPVTLRRTITRRL